MTTNEREETAFALPATGKRQPSGVARRLGRVALLIACVGCGQGAAPVGEVQGRVTYDGEPVAGANVVFENAERGWIRAAELDNAGIYRMSDVKLAPYKVSIQPPTPQTPNENTHPDGNFVIKPGMVPDPKNIPKPYREAHTSSLSVEVEAGPNQFDFELSASPE